MEVLSQDNQMLHDSARRYLADHQPVAAFRKLQAETTDLAYDLSAFEQMSELGWMGLILPEKYGGSAFGYRAAGLIAQQLGRNLTALPFTSTAIMAATIMAAAGDAMLAQWGEQIATGKCVMALAHDETTKHQLNPLDASVLAATAIATEQGYRLSGKKQFIIDGYKADRLIITATLDGELALFCVATATDNLQIDKQILMDNRNCATAKFNNLILPKTDLIVQGEMAQNILSKALSAGRAIVAAEQVGIAKEVAARTLDYLNTRKQFGVVIGSFQALQHRAADLYCQIELTASLVATALNALDNEADEAEKLSRAAKAKADRLGKYATEESVQMHGGIGMTNELDLGLFMKRNRVLSEFLGDYACHANWLLADRNI
ncbi:MAG: acyl-CoA/acyl-ACP dehydrogenase [Rhizobiales bacterium]|nr:acyl-CoA/acyl-ACP dehydrogenase [Hyphomicrobiales bacterium]NRB13286.1 acyl-CoA/acyl-ACP dehydrogenase [Hyphomicrobiales bacterium]